MHKALSTLAIVGMLVSTIACGEASPTGHDVKPLDADGGVDDGGTTLCAQQAIACITYTCVNSGDCDPKSSKNSPPACYACITTAAKGALCKYYIDRCGHAAACFN